MNHHHLKYLIALGVFAFSLGIFASSTTVYAAEGGGGSSTGTSCDGWSNYCRKANGKGPIKGGASWRMFKGGDKMTVYVQHDGTHDGKATISSICKNENIVIYGYNSNWKLSGSSKVRNKDSANSGNSLHNGMLSACTGSKSTSSNQCNNNGEIKYRTGWASNVISASTAKSIISSGRSIGDVYSAANQKRGGFGSYNSISQNYGLVLSWDAAQYLYSQMYNYCLTHSGDDTCHGVNKSNKSLKDHKVGWFCFSPEEDGSLSATSAVQPKTIKASRDGAYTRQVTFTHTIKSTESLKNYNIQNIKWQTKNTDGADGMKDNSPTSGTTSLPSGTLSTQVKVNTNVTLPAGVTSKKFCQNITIWPKTVTVNKNGSASNGSDSTFSSPACVTVSRDGSSEEGETGYVYTGESPYNGDYGINNLATEQLKDTLSEQGEYYFIVSDTADQNTTMEKVNDKTETNTQTITDNNSESTARSRMRSYANSSSQSNYNSSKRGVIVEGTTKSAPYVPDTYALNYKFCVAKYNNSFTYQGMREQPWVEARDTGKKDDDGNVIYEYIDHIDYIYTYDLGYSYSSANCYDIAKKPNARIINGGAYGGISDDDDDYGFHTSLSQKIPGVSLGGSGTEQYFGSWAEYLVNSKGKNSLFASGSTLINGNSNYNNLSPLTIANNNGSHGNSNISAGNFLERIKKKKYIEQCDISSNITDWGIYYCRGDMNISENVDTLNGWFVADGDIHTCSGYEVGSYDFDAYACNGELNINGLLYAAGNVYLNRTYGAEYGGRSQSAQSAEIINLGAESYRQAFENAAAQTTTSDGKTVKQATTVYITELAPRK